MLNCGNLLTKPSTHTVGNYCEPRTESFIEAIFMLYPSLFHVLQKLDEHKEVNEKLIKAMTAISKSVESLERRFQHYENAEAPSQRKRQKGRITVDVKV